MEMVGRPAKLPNNVTEYNVPSQIRSAYQKVLCIWINNGWLIPTPMKKLDLLKA